MKQLVFCESPNLCVQMYIFVAGFLWQFGDCIYLSTDILCVGDHQLLRLFRDWRISSCTSETTYNVLIVTIWKTNYMIYWTVPGAWCHCQWHWLAFKSCYWKPTVAHVTYNITMNICAWDAISTVVFKLNYCFASFKVTCGHVSYYINRWQQPRNGVW